MGKWKCIKCDYVYNPAKGDISRDIKKDTPFDKLPKDWACPKCGSSHDQFSRM
jgi:rubredoxin